MAAAADTTSDTAYDNGILIAKHGDIQCLLLPDKANRHGLITGATGTGKTITLQTLAEGFSKLGVPVFMADVKGDLTGISQAGIIGQKLAAVLKERGLDAPESGSPGARHGQRPGAFAAGPYAQSE